MPEEIYNINIRHEDKTVEILFTGTSTPFSSVKKALLEVREYIKTGYKVKVKGYMYKESKVLQAFIFALDLVGMEDVIVFENKSRYSKSQRKLLKRKAIDLMRSGMTVKEISRELHVPLKTVYRWVKEEKP